MKKFTGIVTSAFIVAAAFALPADSRIPQSPPGTLTSTVTSGVPITSGAPLQVAALDARPESFLSPTSAASASDADIVPGPVARSAAGTKPAIAMALPQARAPAARKSRPGTTDTLGRNRNKILAAKSAGSGVPRPEKPAPGLPRSIASDNPFAQPSGDRERQPLLASAPPEEFEELLRAQKTVVDVFFGGERLGTALAEFTPDSIRFLNPEEVISRIPNVISRAALINHFSGDLPRNSELVCATEKQPGCGKLEPDFIGVIFDENRFRAEVFVHPDMLMVSAQSLTRHLPEADHNALGLVQNINAVASQDSMGTQRHNLSGLTYVSKGMQRVYSQWSNTDAEGLTVQELAWQQDTHQHEFTAGLFQARSDALSLARSEYLVGGGLGRSFKTRTDLDYMQGSEIPLFLTSRSQIEIYKDGRLMSTRIYGAGHVQLDTSRLPAGAYDIEIRIRDVDGVLRTINRYFVKTNRLAPKGEPLYFVEGGAVVGMPYDGAFPGSRNAWQLRGGYQKRHTETLGWNAGGAITETHALAEGGATLLQSLYEVNGLAGLSTQGDYGFSAGTTARFGPASTSLYWREIRNAEPVLSPEYQLMPAQESRISATVAWPFKGGQAQVNVEDASTQQGDLQNYSVRYLRPLPRLNPLQATLTAELSHADGDLFAQVAIAVSRNDRHISSGGTVGLTNTTVAGAEKTAVTGNAIVSWRDEDLRPEQIEAALRVASDASSTVIGADGLLASQYGRLELTAESINSETGNSGARVSASYDTNFVVDNQGLAIGGHELAPAAVILDLRGDAAGAVFDVLVDGQKVQAISSGHRSVLPLSAYRSYNVQLVDRGLTFVSFDESVRQVTLYPGSVVTLDWEVKAMKIAMGRIRLKETVCSELDGNCVDARIPLRNALIKGASGFGMTDDDGRFQIEIITGTRSLSVTRRDSTCEVTLPATPPEVNNILKLGDLDCLPPGSAPATETAAGTTSDAATGTPSATSADSTGTEATPGVMPPTTSASEATETETNSAETTPAATTDAGTAPTADAPATATDPETVTAPAPSR